MFCVSVELSLGGDGCPSEGTPSSSQPVLIDLLGPSNLRFDCCIDIVIPQTLLEQFQKGIAFLCPSQRQIANNCVSAKTDSSTVNDKPQIPDEPELVKKVRKNSISEKVDPFQLCEVGVGGTYFVVDEITGKRIGVFKPVDEEPGAHNNPKNKLLDKPLLPPGGGAKREVAAYLLDHKGFARVPETHFLHDIQHGKWRTASGTLISKKGSIQTFVENAEDTSSLGASLFSVEDVQSIGILDVRLFNMDRNSENLLAVPCGPGNKNYRLVPIDHSYILPNTLDNAYFEWFTWKQTKAPFSAETLQYIADIDIDADANLLASIGIEEDCIRTMKLSTTVLKKGAAAGLTLHQIALLVARRNPAIQSELEKTVALAEKEDDFNAAFDRLVDKMVSEAKATA